MPKIAPRYFNVRLSDRQDDMYSYKADVFVTSKGEFSITIPEHLAPACVELLKAENPHPDDGPVYIRENLKNGQPSGEWKVYAHDKTLAVDLIERAIRIYAKAETTTEIVICYAHDSEGRYVVGPNGEIATDGYDVDANFGKTKNRDRLKDGWKWSDKEHNHFGNRSVFKFGIGAQVYKKITIKRSTGTTIRYEVYWGEKGSSHFDRETYCQRLNSFDISFGLTSRYDNKHPYPNEIPYTEEAAKFFFDAMVSLCSVSERVKNFFGDGKRLQKAIESRATLMLGSGDGQ